MSGDLPQDSATKDEATATPAADLSEQLANAIADRDKYKDGLLRAMADADNFRKRARRDAEDSVRKAKEEVLRELLPVFDNLERALKYEGVSADPKAMAKGLEMVHRLFEDTLQRLGGARVKAVGAPFDPQLHEAVQQMQSTEHPAGFIMAEALAGYLFQERLLRPAMVVVSQGPGPEASKDAAPDPPKDADTAPGEGS